MKGMTGLIIAGVLGLFGLAFNWFYLEHKSSNLEMVSYLAIKPRVNIEPGDTLQEDHFQEVMVPRKHAEHLADSFYLWRDREVVVGTKATQDYSGGELFLKEDYRTPSFDIQLQPDERLLPINVADRSPLIQPGDSISFWIPGVNEDGSNGLLGPFRVGAIGNQIGSSAVMRAYRIPHQQANQLGIIAKVDGDRFDQRTEKLLELLSRADSRGIKAILHPDGSSS